MTLGVVRLGLASAGMTVFLLARGELTPARVRSWDRRTWTALLSAGVAFGLHWLLFFLSIKMASASVGAIGFSTYGLHLVVLGRLLGFGRVAWLDWIGLVLAFLGTLLLVPEFDFENSMTTGLLVGILSGLAAAFLPLVHQHHVATDTNLRAWGQFTFALPVFGLLWPWTEWTMRFEDLPLILYLGLGIALVGHGLWVHITTVLSTTTISIISYLYLPSSILMAYLVIGESEKLSGQMLLGTGLVLAANGLGAVEPNSTAGAASRTGGSELTYPGDSWPASSWKVASRWVVDCGAAEHQIDPKLKGRFLVPKLILHLSMLMLLVTQVAADERPNILFCLADDWGWPHAGVYGDRVVETPTFDRLAREGVLCRRAFVASPSCTPSRNAILTGQQFYRLGEGANLHSTLDPRHPNFMFLLRDAGYEIGHWRKAWGPGKHLALGYEEHPCGPGSTFAKFCAERDEDKPFCFWLGSSDPHRAYEAGSGAAAGMDVAQVRVPSFYPDVPEIRSDIADYYLEVQRWDSDVGKALELLEQAGELDNTIIVMTGDHGMPFPRCKGNLYDWGTRVPLAIRWANAIQAGQEFRDFVSLTDLAPTFLEAAGVEVPAQMTGRSLLGLVSDRRGSESAGREFVVYGRERHTPAQEMPSMNGYPSRALRTDRWLLILNLEPERWPAGVPTGATHPIGSFADCDDGPTKRWLVAHEDDPEFASFYALSFAKRPGVELYDCRQDPDQVHNLAGAPEHAETVKRLRRQLLDNLQSTGDPRFAEGDAPFDGYPYRAEYLQVYLKEKGY